MSKKQRPKLDKRAIILFIAQCQLMIETTDAIEGTVLYRQKIKLLTKQLQKELENVFKLPGIAEGFITDEQSFRKIHSGMEDIMEWVANSDYEDIIDLGLALKEGRIKFVE